MNNCLNPRLLLLPAIIVLNTLITYADNIAPEMPTQTNEQSDLFEKSIDNFADFTGQIESSKQEATDSLAGAKGLEIISSKSKSEIEQSSGSLSAIGEHELNGRGREELIKSNNLNELYTDYKRPLNKQYMQDAKNIANGQDKLLGNLLGKLKDLGIDCKTVKGDKKIEPEYFLQVRTTDHKDTIYNQTFCEELRNKYNCRDILSVTCIKRGMQWNPWQYREIKIAGNTVYHGAKHLGYAIFWKKKRWGWHLVLNSAGWRVFLSNHLGIPLQQIHEQIHFPGGSRGIGGTHPVYEQWRIVFNYYLFGYNYREGHEICEQWSENWTERCYIQ